MSLRARLDRLSIRRATDAAELDERALSHKQLEARAALHFNPDLAIVERQDCPDDELGAWVYVGIRALLARAKADHTQATLLEAMRRRCWRDTGLHLPPEHNDEAERRAARAARARVERQGRSVVKP